VGFNLLANHGVVAARFQDEREVGEVNAVVIDPLLNFGSGLIQELLHWILLIDAEANITKDAWSHTSLFDPSAEFLLDRVHSTTPAHA